MCNTIEEFNEMPEEVKAEVISIMGMFSEVGVVREFGRYKPTTCYTIAAYYAPDHKVWRFTKDELRKEYADQIKAEEDRFYEESKDMNWELLND